MKSLLAAWALALLGLGAVGCDGASDGVRSTSRANARVGTSGSASATTDFSVTSTQRYLNDGDNDPNNDNDEDDLNGKKTDEDDDYPEDQMNPKNDNYHDKDDSNVVSYGHVAGPVDRRAVAVLVKRYYVAALAGDGAKACAMIVQDLAKAIPEDYAQISGPAYLRGAKTCPAVMVLLFKHVRTQLTNSFEVTDVRVNGNQAIALLGSTTMSASSITVKREGDAWKIDALIGSPLR